MCLNLDIIWGPLLLFSKPIVYSAVWGMVFILPCCEMELLNGCISWNYMLNKGYWGHHLTFFMCTFILGRVGRKYSYSRINSSWAFGLQLLPAKSKYAVQTTGGWVRLDSFLPDLPGSCTLDLHHRVRLSVTIWAHCWRMKRMLGVHWMARWPCMNLSCTSV